MEIPQSCCMNFVAKFTAHYNLLSSFWGPACCKCTALKREKQTGSIPGHMAVGVSFVNEIESYICQANLTGGGTFES